MKEKWVLNNKKADLKAITDSFGVSPVLAKLLVNKGLTEEAQIRQYLYPSRNDLHHYSLMKDMTKAIRMIRRTIDNGGHICIVGDYDVDGVTSTYLLSQAFTELGAFVTYRIPDRINDGYGINTGIIENAIDEGCDLIVTCDNGIAAVDAVRYAKERGIEIIITDHHDCPENLPPADCIVDPKQKDCEYPFKGICGAVVAAKLCEGLFEDYGFPPFMERYMDILALATVCDVMELRNENRYIVKEGLSQLSATKNIGLRALIEETGLLGKELSTYSLGFVLGPCLNATGRLESAMAGVALLGSRERTEAASYARKLKELNDIRKDMTMKAAQKACELVRSSALINDDILVVYIPDCHESLAGIVAGRVREEFNRPSIVFTDSSANEELLKGSGRSTEDYNMYEGLTKAKEYILKFGGHPMAAGLTIARDMLGELRKKLNSDCTERLADKPKKVLIDISIPLSSFSMQTVTELAMLEPTGNGNERPVFADRNVEIKRLSRFGREGGFIKAEVRDSRGNPACLKSFYNSEELLDGIERTYGSTSLDKAFRGDGEGIFVSLIYNPEINEYGGRRSLEYLLKNVSFPEEAKEGRVKEEPKSEQKKEKSFKSVIFGAAEGIPNDIKTEDEDLVIFCDGGLRYINNADRGRCILLGDFDSLEESSIGIDREDLKDGTELELSGKRLFIRRFPERKDDTDLLLAVKLSLDEGADEIRMYGCAGGSRPDHRLSALAALAYAAGNMNNKGRYAAALLFDGKYTYAAVKGRKNETKEAAGIAVKNCEGARASVFSFGGRAEGVSLSGFDYDADSISILPDSSLGASNMVKKNSALIRLDKGTVIAVIECEPDKLEFLKT